MLVSVKLGVDTLLELELLNVFPFWSNTTQLYAPLVLLAVVSVLIISGWHPAMTFVVNSAIGSSIVIIVSISTASTHPCTLFTCRVTITVSSSLGITYVGGVIVFEVVNILPLMSVNVHV